MILLRKIFVSFCLIMVGCGFALGIFELFLRAFFPQPTGVNQYAYDSQLGYVPQRNQKGDETFPGVYHYFFSHNAEGFRENGNPFQNRTASFRILFLGDSFAYGWGVNNEQTFVSIVERKSSAGNRFVQAINAACPATGTEYALRFFQLRGEKIHPNLTALCFFSNDFADNQNHIYFDITPAGTLRLHSITKPLERANGKAFVVHAPFLMNSVLYNWLISHSQAVSFTKHAVGRILFTGKLFEHPIEAPKGYSTAANIKTTQIFLGKLREQVLDSGSKFIVFYIPREEEVQAYRNCRKLSADEIAFRKILKGQHQPFISLTPVLASLNVPLSELYFDPKKDGHWTAAAHQIAGNYMSRRLAEHYL